MSFAPPPPTNTDDGADLAVPDPQSDVGRLIYLLEWARIRGFRIGPTVRVGALILQVVDLRQDESPRGHEAPIDPGPWAAAGYTGDE